MRISKFIPERILNQIDFNKWIIENDCYKKYQICSLALIFSKCYWDNELLQIKLIYGEVGSGSYSDPKTLRFIKKNKNNLPYFVRKGNLYTKP